MTDERQAELKRYIHAGARTITERLEADRGRLEADMRVLGLLDAFGRPLNRPVIGDTVKVRLPKRFQ